MAEHNKKTLSSNTSKLCILILVMLIVTLSCTILGGDEEKDTTTEESLRETEIELGIQQTLVAKEAAVQPTEAPTEPPAAPTAEAPAEELPTQAAVPTEEIPVVEVPTNLINPSASNPGDIYYAENFEDMEGWSVYQMHGDPNGFSTEIFDNRLRTDIQTQDTWVYYFFDGGGEFQDVRIDLTAQNRASNTNFVGLICRYSDDGWYEANILNTGQYAIFYGGPTGLEDTIYKGNSTLILTGRETNSYALICRGETLTLYINGVEVYSMPLRTGDYQFLDSGQVGLSVSTTYAIPVVVDFLELILSVP